MFYFRCTNCTDIISSGTPFLSCGKNYWHVDHFICCGPDCSIDLASETFYVHDDRPYCEIHHYFLFAPKCAGCNYPITEAMLVAGGNKYHEHCLKCAECGMMLGASGKFVTVGNKVFCHKDYELIFAPFCAR